MHSDLYVLEGIFLLSVLLCSLILWFVARNGVRDKSNRYFQIFIGGLLLWILTLGFYYAIQDEWILTIIGRLNFAASTLFSSALLAFVYHFPRVVKKYHARLIQSYMFASALVGAITLLTSYVSKHEYIIDGQHVTDFGPLYAIFAVHLLGSITYSVILATKKYRALEKLQKQQLLTLVYGIALASLFGVCTNIVLPYFFNYFELQVYSPISGIILAAFIAKSIVSYRFMDIRIAVRRAFVFLGTATYAFLSFYFVYWMQINLFNTIYGFSSYALGILNALAFVISYSYLRNWLELISNRFFFAGLYRQQDVLSKLSTVIDQIADPRKISQVVSQIIRDVMGVDSVACIAEQSDSDIVVLSSHGHWVCPPEQLLPVRSQSEWLMSVRKEVFIRDEALILAEREHYHAQEILGTYDYMESKGVAIYVPLHTPSQFVGVIILGDKMNGQLFTREDIELIDEVGRRAASAIQNSLLYQQVQDFNANLQKKVAEQTKDITEKADRLEKLLEMRSMFLNIASHQLRTPVTVINGTLSMMTDGSWEQIDENMKKEMIRGMQVKGIKLHEIINDILAASEMDTVDFKPELSDEVDVNDWLTEIVNSRQDQAKEKHLPLTYEPMQQSVKVRIGRRYLDQAMFNLIDNAVHYTEKGWVKVSAMTAEKNGKKGLQITVADTGMGIPAGEINKLFDKFVRAANARLMYPDGSGLGLFICKKIVEGHPGGMIWVESVEGKGSQFHIFLAQ